MKNDKSIVDASLVSGTGKKSKILEERRRLLKEILESFEIASEAYDARISVQAIFDFMNSESLMGRIPYYDITTTIFLADDTMRGQMLTNIEKLVEKVCGDEEETLLSSLIDDKDKRAKCREIIWKISDHIHLASFQMNSITESAVKESQRIFAEEVKSMERNYIAILGIFASIITVSIGGFNYSIKAFEAVNNLKNIPALIGLSTIIGLVLISLSGIMVNLIFSMIDKRWKWERVILPSIGILAAGVIMYLLAK